MAPLGRTPCKFSARGACKFGESCNYVHEGNTGAQTSFASVAPASAVVENVGLDEARSNRICRFFVHGSCNKGDECRYLHSKATEPSWRVHANPASASPHPGGPRDESSPRAPWDSRASVPCKYLSRPSGCQNKSCTFRHTGDGHEVAQSSSQEEAAKMEDEGQEHDDDIVRDLSGASVSFGDVGHVVKVSFPSDFSIACITGLAPGSSPTAVVEILRDRGFDIHVDCVRLSARPTTAADMQATVKVEDPSFAKELSSVLKKQSSPLSATPRSMVARRTDCRKVYISWHKATRSAWMSFGTSEIANRVAQKFNQGKYRCLGHLMRSSRATGSPSRGFRSGFSSNPVPWSITLSNVPSDATSMDFDEAVTSRLDKPRHVEMGSMSYRALEEEVSVEVRLHLEEFGPLESFYLAPTSRGKRAKATAWFQDEADARLACSLDNKAIDHLKGGRLTVTSIHSAKIKVSTVVYLASKSRLDETSKTWAERRLTLHGYPDTLQRFTTLKVEGNNPEDVASARKILDKILSGTILQDGDDVIWASSLDSNGSAYRKLKSIEKELDVLITRDKLKRQLHFFGSREKLQKAVHQITDMLREESSASYEIVLDPDQFSWTIHGGFRSIKQGLGDNVAIFNVVSRKIIINGTQQQYETALAAMRDRRSIMTRRLSESSSKPEADCPICRCEADTPVETSCKHTYCLQCFEDCCKSAASTSENGCQIKCHGDKGACSSVFTLLELKDHLSSSMFEAVLKLFFESHIKCHPEDFHYCPTPDCGYVYRCTEVSGSKAPAYTCPNCLEPVCTACHARHGDYTCADYKDISSGGYKALEKVKKELNIKDCPKCTTPMEKTEGCNHMTCVGCEAHICWACMAVFETSGPCYEHMNREHQGIGLGLERFIH